jgi:hypothetical protein
LAIAEPTALRSQSYEKGLTIASSGSPINPAPADAGVRSQMRKGREMKALMPMFLFLVLWLPCSVMAGEVLVATEVQSCFYADGKMDCSPGEFKNTYYREGDKIVRTNVFNFKKKQSITDNTVYKVIADLSSDPRNNPGGLFPQVTQAIGFPGTDAVEILSIDKTHIQAVKSTSNYFAISRFKITKE